MARINLSMLKDLAEDSIWKSLGDVKAKGNAIGNDEVFVSFSRAWLGKDVERTGPVKMVCVKMGFNIVRELDIQKGDRVKVVYNPDDPLTWKIIKSADGKGYKVSHEKNCKHLKVNFTWRVKPELWVRKSKAVNFQIYKQQLILYRIGSEDEAI